MWQNLGTTLALIRALRGQSQTAVAKAARVGKGQLSKYEHGIELPRLDSLSRVLEALGVGYQQFFSTMSLVDRESASTATSPGGHPADAANEELVVELLKLVREKGVATHQKEE